MSRPSRIRLTFDRRAATALEFALLCIPFTAFVLAVMAAGLQFYLQQALDSATQRAARQVQLGLVPASYTPAEFASNVVCPVLGQFQTCGNLFADVRPVSDYQQLALSSASDAPNSTATTGFKFCAGQPGQLMYVHVVFLAPSIGGSLLNYGSVTNPIIANAAFANENPAGTAVPPPAC